MNTIDTLSDLLTSSQCHFKIYDIGRKINHITQPDFLKIENNQSPYPFPVQQHAHFAIVFWQEETSQPFIWFIKLPLDEQGMINQGARNHFISIVIAALGSDLTQHPTQRQEQILKENPYLAVPPQYKLAALNAIVSNTLKQPPSQYYQDFLHYLAKENLSEHWQNIALQGISDFACRINEKANTQRLINALVNLPTEVLFPLCTALENIELPDELIAVLIHYFSDSSNELIKQHLFRSLASSYSNLQVQSLTESLLFQQQLSADMLIVFVTRNWQLLSSKSLVMALLEHIVSSEKTSNLFLPLFKDLVAIPAVRPILMQCIREPNRSEALSIAIGHLFSQHQSGKSRA